MLVNLQTLPAELLGAGDVAAVADAPVLVAEGVVADPVHAAEDQPFLPVDSPVQVDAQPLGLKVVEQRLKDMGVVVAEVGEDRDRPGLLHGPEVLAHLREELPLEADRLHLGQEVACDEDEARLLRLDGGHQVAPLLNALVQVAGQDELQVHGSAARSMAGWCACPVGGSSPPGASFSG